MEAAVACFKTLSQKLLQKIRKSQLRYALSGRESNLGLWC